MQWYTIVASGGAYTPTPARGPHQGIEAAESAIARFRQRHGHKAGSYLAATSCRIVGPFNTRHEAQEADISDATRIVASVL